MAIKKGLLRPAQVDSLPPGTSKKTGKPHSKLYPDGNNLYLRVKETGSRSWVFVYRWQGKQPEVGLGKAGKGGISLADARAKALHGSTLLSQKPKIDPRTAWGLKPAAGGKTFGAEFERYYALHQAGWSKEHAKQWRVTVETYCRPLLAMPLDQIDTAAVLGVLEPIWTRIPESASRVRSRIEIVLAAGKGDDETRPNPARWRHHLEHKLPSRKKLGLRPKRHASLPFTDAPAFAKRLRAVDSVTARALEFLLLTATRSAEGRGAQWSEIDFQSRVWTVPLERMKTGKHADEPHQIPLSDRAMEILEAMRTVSSGAYVFPGRFPGTGIGDNMVLLLAKELGADTVHGLRSTFRNWVGETTTFARELAELALSHAVAKGSEASYWTGKSLEKRAPMMEAWSRYCAPPEPSGAANVVPMERKRAMA